MQSDQSNDYSFHNHMLQRVSCKIHYIRQKDALFIPRGGRIIGHPIYICPEQWDIIYICSEQCNTLYIYMFRIMGHHVYIYVCSEQWNTMYIFVQNSGTHCKCMFRIVGYHVYMFRIAGHHVYICSEQWVTIYIYVQNSWTP